MKVIIFNKGKFRDIHEQLRDIDENSEKRNEILKTKSGSIILSAPRTVLPYGVIFHTETIEDSCTIRRELGRLFSIGVDQILIEVTNGIYYSGRLAWQQCNNFPFHHPSSWDYRKIFVLKNGGPIAEKRVTPDTGIEECRKRYPDADEFLEVWCQEWEYSDQYVLDYWFEWRGPCLWGGNLITQEKYGYAIDVDNLPLSPQTKERVKEMIRWHDTALDWDNPGGDSPWTDEENERFEKAETELYEDLKKELGDEFEIRRN